MVSGNNIFELISDFYHELFWLLDKPVIYGNIKYIRIVFGFIVLSACISVFWKGAKG